MTDLSLQRNLRPVPATLLQRGPDLGVEFDIHGQIIAKFCDMGKQPIARRVSHSFAMANRSLNQVLGANLDRIMKARGLSANVLGAKAKVAPNTIGNYLKAADKEGPSGVSPTSGKERSAKLAEIELLARALGINPLALLTDAETTAATVQAITAAVSVAIAAPPQFSAPILNLTEATAQGEATGAEKTGSTAVVIEMGDQDHRGGLRKTAEQKARSRAHAPIKKATK